MTEDELIAHLQSIMAQMPPVSALHLSIVKLGDEGCALRAPLSANVNDKGCAFGGSLVSMMTLAGWALVTAWLEKRRIKAEVYVADSAVKYKAPVYDDLDVRATLDAAFDTSAVLASLRDRRRAEFFVQSTSLRADGRRAVSMQSRYVAVLPEHDQPVS